MALLFFFVGLELKAGDAGGQLSDPRRRRCCLCWLQWVEWLRPPDYLALAGSAGFTRLGDPAATDIAFALGVLSLLGSRVPAAPVTGCWPWRWWTIWAHLIVAFFYTEEVLVNYLVMATGVASGAGGEPSEDRLHQAIHAGGRSAENVMYPPGISPTIGSVIVAACAP